MSRPTYVPGGGGGCIKKTTPRKGDSSPQEAVAGLCALLQRCVKSLQMAETKFFVLIAVNGILF